MKELKDCALISQGKLSEKNNTIKPNVKKVEVIFKKIFLSLFFPTPYKGSCGFLSPSFKALLYR